MEIINVTVADTQALLEIYAPYVEKTAISFEYTVPTVKEFEDRIKAISSKYPYIKAVEKGKVLGYAYANTFKPRAAYNYAVEVTVYVKEDKRKNGIGTALYRELEKRLKEMGIINMNACITKTLREKDGHLTNASIVFHSKMGFKQVAEFNSCGFKFNKWYNMIWMEKIIGKHTDNPPELNL